MPQKLQNGDWLGVNCVVKRERGLEAWHGLCLGSKALGDLTEFVLEPRLPQLGRDEENIAILAVGVFWVQGWLLVRLGLARVQGLPV